MNKKSFLGRIYQPKCLVERCEEVAAYAADLGETNVEKSKGTPLELIQDGDDFGVMLSEDGASVMRLVKLPASVAEAAKKHFDSQGDDDGNGNSNLTETEKAAFVARFHAKLSVRSLYMAATDLDSVGNNPAAPAYKSALAAYLNSTSHSKDLK